MYTVDEFEAELRLIKNEEIRDFIRYCLEKAPPYFYEVPSSSGGKYHPSWANGEGGLVRHSRAAAILAVDFARMYKLEGNEADAVVAATIIHDICKWGIPGGKYTTPDHSYTGAKYVHNLAAAYGKEVPKLKEILGGVAWHNGQWEKRTNGQKVKSFPEEFSLIEQAVHCADYTASRAYITINNLEPNLIG